MIFILETGDTYPLSTLDPKRHGRVEYPNRPHVTCHTCPRPVGADAGFDKDDVDVVDPARSRAPPATPPPPLLRSANPDSGGAGAVAATAWLPMPNMRSTWIVRDTISQRREKSRGARALRLVRRVRSYCVIFREPGLSTNPSLFKSSARAGDACGVNGETI